MKKINHNKGPLSILLSITITFLFVFTLVTAATTINENINTEGTLTVTGASTLATTTISTDLTVDTDTFYVDSVNGRIGVGTTTPNYKLDINGSINIPISDENFDKEIMQKIKEMDKKIVVYCANKHCSASPRAAKHLEQLGFKNVYDYEGGIEEWDGDYCFEKEGENICMKENKKTEEKEICSVC